MNKQFVWLLCFGLFAVVVVGSDDETLTCAVPDYFGSYDIPVQTAAVPWPSSGTEFCGSQLGDYSCCSNTTFDAMIASYKAARLALNISATIIYEAWEVLDETMDLLWEALDEEAQQALEDSLGAAIDILDTFGEKYPPAAFKCAYGMLNYSVGAMCVACSSDWSKYITTSGDTVTLHFDEDTCDEVYDQCSDLLDVTQELNDMFYALLEGDDTPPQICTDDSACKEYVCGTMLSGGLSFTVGVEPPTFKKKKAVSTVTNTYESGGFPAYECGAQSNVAGTTDDNNTGKIVLICICVAAAILAAVVVIVVVSLVVYKKKLSKSKYSTI